jgi:hypothetical protein
MLKHACLPTQVRRLARIGEFRTNVLALRLASIARER